MANKKRDGGSGAKIDIFTNELNTQKNHIYWSSGFRQVLLGNCVNLKCEVNEFQNGEIRINIQGIRWDASYTKPVPLLERLHSSCRGETAHCDPQVYGIIFHACKSRIRCLLYNIIPTSAQFLSSLTFQYPYKWQYSLGAHYQSTESGINGIDAKGPNGLSLTTALEIAT